MREKQWMTLCSTEDNIFLLIFLDINTDECLYGLVGLRSGLLYSLVDPVVSALHDTSIREVPQYACLLFATCVGANL